MNIIMEVKSKIEQLSAAAFQEMCDSLLMKKYEFNSVNSYGLKAGTQKTKKGIPDSYFINKMGKYVFAEYTIQKSNLFKKMREDINKCIEFQKDKMGESTVKKIIYCHSSTLSADKHKELNEMCLNNNIELEIFGIDTIAQIIVNEFPEMLKIFFGIQPEEKIFRTLDEFIKDHDSNEMVAHIGKIKFEYRIEEKKELIEKLEKRDILLITGNPGVGKTMIGIEVAREFSEKKGYEFLNIVNYADNIKIKINEKIKKNNKYLIFIDDANEFEKFRDLVQLINSEHEIKFIITVRTYALKEIQSILEEYSEYSSYKVKEVENRYIKDFIEKNFNIKNYYYSEQILNICNGNFRLAFMAGKLLNTSGSFLNILDVTELYRKYYSPILDGTLKQNWNMLKILGIIAFLGYVDLKNLFHIEKILNKNEIDLNEFKQNIRFLFNNGILDIYEERVIKISDQSFANYIIYEVFLKENNKLLSISEMINEFYDQYRDKTIYFVNIIINMYNDKKEYCYSEINNVLLSMEKEKNKKYFDFVKDFHLFFPEKAFIIAESKISEIESENFDYTEIDFGKNIYRESYLLKLLEGYKKTEYEDVVIELYNDFIIKTSSNMIEGSNWIKKNYGIDREDLVYKYEAPKKITENFLNNIRKGKEILRPIAFNWAEYALKNEFISILPSFNKKYEINYDQINVSFSEELLRFREKAWDIIYELTHEEYFKSRIIEVLDYYFHNINFVDEFLFFEKEKIEKIFIELNNNSIGMMKVLNKYITCCKKNNIEYDDKLTRFFINKNWELYKIFKDETYNQDTINEKIFYYRKRMNISEIKDIVNFLKVSEKDDIISHELYSIIEGIKKIIREFNINELIEFLKQCSDLKFTEIFYYTEIIIDILVKNMESAEIIEIIEKYCENNKLSFVFEYIKKIKHEQVNFSLFEKIKEIIEENIFEKGAMLNIKLMDIFKELEPNIYILISKLILEKSGQKIEVIERFFGIIYKYSKEKVDDFILKYKNDISIIEKIFFTLIISETYSHLAKNILWSLVELNEENLTKIIKYNESKKCRNEILCSLWKSKNYMYYFDLIFQEKESDGTKEWEKIIFWKTLLIRKSEDEETDERKKKWILNRVIKDSKINKISILFDIICNSSKEIRREAIRLFLENNQDFNTFKNIQLTATTWTISGEDLSPFTSEINFLESLLGYVSKKEFLKHKELIKNEIKKIKEYISEKQLSYIKNNDF